MSDYPDRKVHEALLNELCDLFDWSDRSALHALMHVKNAVENLRADLATEKVLREKAEARLAGYQSAPVHMAATVLKGRLDKVRAALEIDDCTAMTDAIEEALNE